jgi:hypothetical protein
MTLSAIVARRRKTKKITENGENNPFSNPCFSGGKIP